jgi:hypothetical protein
MSCACSSNQIAPPNHNGALTHTGSGGSGVIGLLRWPQPGQHKAMPLPLVTMAREGRNLTLLARSVDEYLHRCAYAFACVCVRACVCVCVCVCACVCIAAQHAY